MTDRVFSNPKGPNPHCGEVMQLFVVFAPMQGTYGHKTKLTQTYASAMPKHTTSHAFHGRVCVKPKLAKRRDATSECASRA